MSVYTRKNACVEVLILNTFFFLTGRRVCFLSHFRVYNLRKLRKEIKIELWSTNQGWRLFTDLVPLTSSAQLVSYISQAILNRKSTAPVACPTRSILSQENDPQVRCRPMWSRQFFNWSFPFEQLKCPLSREWNVFNWNNISSPLPFLPPTPLYSPSKPSHVRFLLLYVVCLK